MGIVKIIRGDVTKLFDDGAVKLIAHGCNCMNLMGAGIAKTIAEKYPKALKHDHAQYIRCGGDVMHTPVPNLLGTMTTAKIGKDQYIANLYTQCRTGKCAEYRYLEQSLEQLREFCESRSIKRIALPLIGCGIGGLDYAAVLPLINVIFKEIDVIMVVWTGDFSLYTKVVRSWSNYSFPKVFDGECTTEHCDGYIYLNVDDVVTEHRPEEVFVNRHHDEQAVTVGETDYRIFKRPHISHK